MATLLEQSEKAKKLNPKVLEKEIFDFIKSIQEVLIDKNKNQIQETSKDIFGNPLGFYSKATEVITKGRKKSGEPFSGYETGEFFKGFYIQEVSGVLRFSSTSPHWADIQKSKSWLSLELFGLNDDNLRTIIREKILPYYTDHTRKILDL